MPSRLALSCAALALGLGTAIAACGGSADQRSEGRYCTEVGNHLTALNSPSIQTPADIDTTLAAWRTVAQSAPLAIQQEWDTMVKSMETAATVKPNDPASMQKVADTARASEPAANRVIDYTYQKCRVTIGKVTPVVTTTSTPPSTTKP
jgi:hypothetical protein